MSKAKIVYKGTRTTPKGLPVTIEMPKAAWLKWERHLLGGEFTQGKFNLYNPKEMSFCCLGVMQAAMDKGCVEIDWDSGDGPRYSVVPSTEWLEYFGVKFYDIRRTGGPFFVEDNTPYLTQFDQSVAGANDAGVSFAEIAIQLKKHVRFTDKGLREHQRYPK